MILDNLLNLLFEKQERCLDLKSKFLDFRLHGQYKQLVKLYLF